MIPATLALAGVAAAMPAPPHAPIRQLFEKDPDNVSFPQPTCDLPL